MKICIVAGARPNFVKVAPIVHAVERARAAGRNIAYCLVYAGPDDDPTLEPTLFRDLRIAPPDVCLGVTEENLNLLTGHVMSAFERHLTANRPDVVIVVDDLASTLAAAIVAKKQGLPLAHLVAGTRSFDITMPKEINRLVIDGLSDLLFTAGVGSGSREDDGQERIYMVGNILIDTLRENRDRLVRPALLDAPGLTEGAYVVLTLNRRALLAEPAKLTPMLRALCQAAAPVPVLAPLRGLALNTVERIMAEAPDIRIKTIAPLPYLQFAYLTAHARAIATDSGNVAEEATFNGVPCATLGTYTEHIETVKQGTNHLVGDDPELLAAVIAEAVAGTQKPAHLPDRWDGRSAERIVQTLWEKFS